MVVTRTMAAAAQAEVDFQQYLEDEGDLYTVDSDHEVTFPSHRQSGVDSIRFGSDPTMETSGTGADRRLVAVELAVQGMNDKFERLLSFLPTEGSTPAPRDRRQTAARHTHQTPPRAGAPPTRQVWAPPAGDYNTRRGHAGPPPPPADFPHRRTLKGPAYDNYVEEQLGREDFIATRADDGKGIAQDILTKHLDPKPYMYVKRPGVNTIKKRLDARESLSFNEYMLAYIKMIRDPRADQMVDVHYHLEHLQHLAEDALYRDWASARAWSQETLDEIEKGSYSWEDRQHIQWERLRHAVDASRPAPEGPRAVREDRANPCRDFNGDRGCTHPTHHGTHPLRFMHICAYCYNQTSRHITTHCRATCIRRDVDSGHRQKGFSKNSGGAYGPI